MINVPESSLSNSQEVRLKALKFLTSREYGYQELKRKLISLGGDAVLVEDVLYQLRMENLQDDERYASSYVRSRVSRGYGMLRIQNELLQKGIDDTVIHAAMYNSAIDWQLEINRVWEKKFKSVIPVTPQDKMKQWRFLQYKGFPQDLIKELFRRLT